MANKSNRVYIDAISLVAPGLDGWQQNEDVLSGKKSYRVQALEKYTASILPANERRRTTRLIKLALQAAQTCVNTSLTSANDYATVFASSDGDHTITDKICRALAQPEHLVSPTQFHNSVHNAPAGYWAIASKAELNSTSLSAGDESFSAGLMDAVAFASIEKKPVLFIAYDYPAPEPLHAARPIEAVFAVAFSLSTIRTENCIAELSLKIIDSASCSYCEDSELEKLRMDNPAARSLPLLQAMAKKISTEIVLPHLNNTALCVQVN